MTDVPVDPAGTVLTERQVQVLALRGAGHTQAEIADTLGTSVANVSAIEGAARDNVQAAHRTLDLVRVLEAQARLTAAGGTDLRNLVDRVFETADEAGLRIRHTDPELTALLHDRLGDRLDGRRLTAPVEVGLTADGDVVLFPTGASVDLPGRSRR